jgi:hypothetical protein
MHTTRIIVSGLAALCLSGASGVAQSGGAPLPAVPPAATPSPALAALEALEARAKPTPEFTEQKNLMAFVAEVTALAGNNSFETGEEFYRLANVARWEGNDFRSVRIRYESLLAAAAKKHAGAEKELLATWSNLLRSLGRPMRTDYMNLATRNPGLFEIVPAPACIQAIWENPAAARAAATGALDNLEVKILVDADQAARRDNSFRTEAGRKADHDRNVRMREIIATGLLQTPADYFNAALVMQHSAGFSGYQLAHELAMCSLLLGERGSAPWLAVASYDRMLRSVGHDQRFGTQQTMEGPPLRVDEEGISDSTRRALGRPSLAALRSVSRSATTNFIKELTGPDNTLWDQKLKISATMPAGWTIGSGQRSDEVLSLDFRLPGSAKARAALYARINPPSAPNPGDDPETFLRADAAKKATERILRFPDYVNRADSFVFRTINGQPTLSWTADYTSDGTRHSEFLVRVLGPKSVALFFLSGPTGEVAAAQAAFDGMAKTVLLP